MNGMREYVSGFIVDKFMDNDVGFVEHSVYANVWYYSVVEKHRTVFGQLLKINVQINDKANYLTMNIVRPNGSAVVFNTMLLKSGEDGYCCIMYTDGDAFAEFMDTIDDLLKEI